MLSMFRTDPTASILQRIRPLTGQRAFYLAVSHRQIKNYLFSAIFASAVRGKIRYRISEKDH